MANIPIPVGPLGYHHKFQVPHMEVLTPFKSILRVGFPLLKPYIKFTNPFEGWSRNHFVSETKCLTPHCCQSPGDGLRCVFFRWLEGEPLRSL